MRTLIFTIILLSPSFAFAAKEPDHALEYAIWMVESGGVLTPPDGDNGKAIGPFQIQYRCWKDVSREVGGKYSDCRSYEYSLKVFRAYCRKYHASSREDAARLWNGGPSRRGTDGYWKKVKRELAKID